MKELEFSHTADENVKVIKLPGQTVWQYPKKLNMQPILWLSQIYSQIFSLEGSKYTIIQKKKTERKKREEKKWKEIKRKEKKKWMFIEALFSIG